MAAVNNFALAVGPDVDLVLRVPDTVKAMHRLTIDNLERLRPWEPWAQGEQTLAGLAAYDRARLLDWVEGRHVPAAIRYRGRLVGAVSAKLDGYAGLAELGYWVDGDHERLGLVTRCTNALGEHVVAAYGVARLEIRAAAHNTRSRAVAERLGYQHEGTLRAALPVGAERHDVAVYGLIPPLPN